MLATLLAYSAVLAIFLILYLLYFIFFKPLVGIKFYKDQGIKMTFFPLLGNVKSCLDALVTTKDFYGHWKNQIKNNPDTKVIGGNSLDSPHVYLLDPELIREFYRNQENYVKAPKIVDFFKLFNREGLIVSEGETWKRHRKIIAAAFHYGLLRDMVPDIVKIFGESLDELKKKDLNSINLNQELELSASEVIGRLFFGQDFHGYRIQGEPVVKFASKLVKKVGSEGSTLLYLILGKKLFDWGLPKHRKMRKDIQDYHDFADSVIQKKKNEFKINNNKLESPGKTSNTLIDILLCQENASTEEGFTTEEISNEFMTFLGSGSSTTAATATRAIYYLHDNPRYTAKLIEEIDKYFGDLSNVTIDTLGQMDFMAAFIKETLRFAPPLIGLVDRQATIDHNLGDLKIQKGTLVNVGGLINNFNPNYYDNEDVFYPERWLTDSQDPFVFIPFSAGPRNCIGQHLAMIEIKIFLSLLLKKYDFVLDPDYKHVMTQRIVYEPLNAMTFKLICK